ncbi:hypothetical protein AeRB84_000885 [Aphanomyces euteiches]|nr:hypothetical protein AeRB84_000885 [Aphanomyces euteiches]
MQSIRRLGPSIHRPAAAIFQFAVPMQSVNPASNFSTSSIPREFLSTDQLSSQQFQELLDTAIDFKKQNFNGDILKNETLLMIFQKRSTRTRLSSEIGMQRLGGRALFLSSDDIQLGVNETLKDSARVMSRFGTILLARVYGHKDIEELARESSIPVINALSDKYHPLQALADYMTIQEHFGSAKGLTVSWVGDGNNVLHDYMLAAPLAGANIQIATPKGYEPAPDVIAKTLELAKAAGTTVTLTNDPNEAVKNANVIATDTWVSMGQEEESKKRIADFAGYQVTKSMLENAASDHIFLHCLPRHAEEVDDEVFYSDRSLVFNEAENRMWTVMAVLAKIAKIARPKHAIYADAASQRTAFAVKRLQETYALNQKRAIVSLFIVARNAMHARGDCLCESILAEDENAQDLSLQKRNITRQYGIPGRLSIYSTSPTEDLLQSSTLYDLLRPKTDNSYSDKDGRRGMFNDTYLATIDREKSTAWTKRAFRAKSQQYFDRAIDNANYNAKVREQMPSEELVDYLIHTSSLKVANVPELLGTMDTSAAIATAIVIEEFVRQEVQAFVAANYQFPSPNEDQLVLHIQELLNGAVPDEILVSVVAKELKCVFGDRIATKFDLDGVIRQEIEATSHANENETMEAWKSKRIADGIRALSDGAVCSDDGIYVTLLNGQPSYWFSAVIPDHGAITSEGYKSYQEAWATKLELEARITAFSEAPQPPSAPSILEETEDSIVKQKVVPAHYKEGILVPVPSYFQKDERMQGILKRIALPEPQTELSLILRQKSQLNKKLIRSREEREERKRLKRQETETTDAWLRRCAAEGRCPHCSNPVDHMNNGDSCLLWQAYESKLGKAEQKMSFLECSFEWFDEPRSIAYDV